ncbi:MAG: queuosine precursor transporter [Lachnotalea sp.]
MPNEIILIGSLVVLYVMVILAYKMFGTAGLYCWTVIATIAANIEVLIMINAFGMEQTLGNILFASTFLVTDILSEMEGKKAANKAVKIGIATSFAFIVISQSWLLYTPNQNDWAMPAIKNVFSNTPRLMIAGIAVYAIVQVFDVWAYHKLWDYTTKACKDSKKFLWLRNNGSTLVSQFFNTLLFTFAAFIGVYDFITLIHIVISSYIIFIVTSLLDTPAVYIARKYCKTDKQKEISEK